MQNKTTEKIIIDKLKLITLQRLGCSERAIIDKVFYDKFTSQNDSLIDTLLESLTDVKSFSNWGGSRENSGRKSSNNNNINQDEKIKMNKSSCNNQLVDKEIDKDKSKDKCKNNNKIKESDVVDWDSLFLYWEQNKEGGKYKNSESRSRMLGRLQTLTNNDLSFAKEVILDAIDHKWQGFCGADGLYYKKPKLASNENIEYRRADSEETHKMASLAEITKKKLEEERIRKFGS